MKIVLEPTIQLTHLEITALNKVLNMLDIEDIDERDYLERCYERIHEEDGSYSWVTTVRMLQTILKLSGNEYQKQE